MSLEALKQELSALKPDEQRQVVAFLVSLQDGRDEAYRRKLSEKIDKPASGFATLREVDERLGFSDDKS